MGSGQELGLAVKSTVRIRARVRETLYLRYLSASYDWDAGKESRLHVSMIRGTHF